MRRIATLLLSALLVLADARRQHGDSGFFSIAKRIGTDKVGPVHSYYHAYDKYLNPLRFKPIKMLEIGWNHDLSEVIQNLIDAGLSIVSFQEFDTSPYNCFRNAVEISASKFQIKGLEGTIPMVYALKACKISG